MTAQSEANAQRLQRVDKVPDIIRTDLPPEMRACGLPGALRPVLLCWQAAGGLLVGYRAAEGRWALRLSLLPLLALAVCNVAFAITVTFTMVTFLLDNQKDVIKSLLLRASLQADVVAAFPILLANAAASRGAAELLQALTREAARLRVPSQPVWPAVWIASECALFAVLLALGVGKDVLHILQVPAGDTKAPGAAIALALKALPLTESQYIVMCHITSLCIRRLAQQVLAVTAHPAPSPCSVDSLRAAHALLVRLSNALHRLYGPQLFLSTLLIRVCLLANAFTLFSALVKANRDADLVSVIAAEVVYYAMRGVLVCSAPSRIAAACEEVQYLATKCDTSTWGSPAKQKWELFRNQVEILRPRLIICGIVKINTGLMLSIIQSTITYLLVLLQFES